MTKKSAKFKFDAPRGGCNRAQGVDAARPHARGARHLWLVFGTNLADFGCRRGPPLALVGLVGVARPIKRN